MAPPRGPSAEEGLLGAPQFVAYEPLKPLGKPEAFFDPSSAYPGASAPVTCLPAHAVRVPHEWKGPTEGTDPATKFVDYKFRGRHLPPGILGPFDGWTRASNLGSPNPPYEPLDEGPLPQPHIPAEGPSAEPSVVTAPPKKGKGAKASLTATRGKECPPLASSEEPYYSLQTRKRALAQSGAQEGPSSQSGNTRGASSSRGSPDLGASASLAVGTTPSGGGLQQELYGRYADEKLLAQAHLDLGCPGWGLNGGDSEELTSTEVLSAAPKGNPCVVVNVRSFCTRAVKLGPPPKGPFGRWLHGIFGFLAECAVFLPRGLFLWELLHPQTEKGFPLVNPQGVYGLRLFLDGAWRVVEIDDFVPVGGPQGSPVFPGSANAHELWGPLIAKGLLKAFRNILAAGGGPPPVIQALTGRREVTLPLSPSLLGSYVLRGIWVTVKLSPAAASAAAAANGEPDAGCTTRKWDATSAAAERERASSLEGFREASSEHMLSWSPFLVAAVREEGAPAVSLLNRQSGGGPLQDIVGAPGAQPKLCEGSECFTQPVAQDSTGPSLEEAEQLSEESFTDFSGTLPLSSPRHPYNIQQQLKQQRAAAAAAAAGEPQIRREKEGGPIIVTRPLAILLQHLLGGTALPKELDWEHYERPPDSCAAQEALPEQKGGPGLLKKTCVATTLTDDGRTPHKPESEAPVINVETPRPLVSPTGAAQLRRSSTANLEKAALLTDAQKLWGVPWATEGPPPVPAEGLRLEGGPWVPWDKLVACLAGRPCNTCSTFSSSSGCYSCSGPSFSVFLPEQMLEGAPLKDLYDYEKSLLPLQFPLRASVCLLQIPKKGPSQAAAAATTAGRAAEEERTAAAKRRRCLNHFRPHTVLLSLEGNPTMVEGLTTDPQERSLQQGTDGRPERGSDACRFPHATACHFLNLDTILPQWAAEAPQIAAWSAASALGPAGAGADPAVFAAAAQILMGPERTNTLAAGWDAEFPPSHELGLTSAEASEDASAAGFSSTSHLLLRRLKDALLAEDLGAPRPGADWSALQMLRLARGFESLLLEGHTGSPVSALLDLGAGIFGFLVFLRAPGAPGPLTVSWRRPLQQHQQQPVEGLLHHQQGKRRGPLVDAIVCPGGLPKEGGGAQGPLQQGFLGSACTHYSLDEFLQQQPLCFRVQKCPIVGPENGGPGCYSVWFKAEVEALWGPSDGSPYLVLMPHLPHAGLIPFLRLSLTPLGSPRRLPLRGALEEGCSASEISLEECQSYTNVHLGSKDLRTLPILPFLKVSLTSQRFPHQDHRHQKQPQHSYVGKYLLLLEAAIPSPSRAVHCALTVALPPPVSSEEEGPILEGLAGSEAPPAPVGEPSQEGPVSLHTPLVIRPLPISFKASWAGDSLWGPAGRYPGSKDLCNYSDQDRFLVCNLRIVARGPQTVRVSLSLKLEGGSQGNCLQVQLLRLDRKTAFDATREASIKDNALHAIPDAPLEGPLAEATETPAAIPKAPLAPKAYPQRKGASEYDGHSHPGSPPRRPEEVLLLQEDGPSVCIFPDVHLSPEVPYILRAHYIGACGQSAEAFPHASTCSQPSKSHGRSSRCSWLLEVVGSGEVLVGPDISKEEFNFAWLSRCDPDRGPRGARSRNSYLNGQRGGPFWRPLLEGRPAGVGEAPDIYATTLQQLQLLVHWKAQMSIEDFFRALQFEALEGLQQDKGRAATEDGPSASACSLPRCALQERSPSSNLQALESPQDEFRGSRDSQGREETQSSPFDLTLEMFCSSKLLSEGPLGTLLGSVDVRKRLYTECLGPLVAAAGGSVTPPLMAAAMERAAWGSSPKGPEEDGVFPKGAANSKKGQSPPDKRPKGPSERPRQAVTVAPRGLQSKGGKDDAKRERSLSVVCSEGPALQPSKPHYLRSPFKPEIYVHPLLRRFAESISGTWPYRTVTASSSSGVSDPPRLSRGSPVIASSFQPSHDCSTIPQTQTGHPWEPQLGEARCSSPSQRSSSELLEATVAYIEEVRALLQQPQQEEQQAEQKQQTQHRPQHRKHKYSSEEGPPDPSAAAASPLERLPDRQARRPLQRANGNLG
ncbi:uncharacterized protein LOC34618272 [Cyclospora cayetanensis]|uniref:Uncharacterized protein LOC34618272 n=1 Tax=Cyclospora cayetanensis TaxID=88456 RepID=A0A6P6RRG3_9EIME|nr:uncharacterized protein LOC34618272 [Cyclospora cayetanensis]